ncbi:MAG TPA: peptidylprolyl isomerase [Pararhizobium sp.]|jgi:peptidyl-prolyl cis-trans isomerase SurA|uniref:peptidylprolyl isomerase n=1 Tax=Rhizobium/Agrobacterium group TaxID=227290 RepID=UPI0006FF105B|nr:MULTISPECIES: peptidylprolyl isomerase [Rhizobium/Agrobacterium group]KQY19649.1 molecular chaperone SurA [Rhizobium sp. Root482]HTO30016.1 peptidylprolyl isomerase [Pararhizobium sp.]
MGGKISITQTLQAMILAVGLAFAATPVAQAASKVAAVVNGSPITTGDIARRAAFMRLQRQSGGTAAARQQLIDEVLKRAEVLRIGASVSTSDVDAAVARFAAGNKLSTAQLSQVLDQAGVGIEHFKQYVAVSMSWPRVVNARYGSGGSGRLSNEELVRRMQANGGNKPVTTEYFLQQVIFVVPASKRNAILGKRQAEANASRSKYPGCEQAKVFAATMRDVSIRNLGRMMAQELPADWKPLIEKAGDGQTTATRVTEKGVEYLGICKKREVSDDVAAEIVFRAEDLGKKSEGESDNSKQYLEELRKKAQIIEK